MVDRRLLDKVHDRFSGKKIYIAGPMSGRSENNHGRFKTVEDLLWKYFDPDEILSPRTVDDSLTGPYAKVFSSALSMSLAADVVVAIDDWWNSRGAITELIVAWNCGKPIYHLKGWNPLVFSEVEMNFESVVAYQGEILPTNHMLFDWELAGGIPISREAMAYLEGLALVSPV